mmetsp:Transcript_3926/g.9958  ORF Transcript_3926/g.9958 Transcript_3926/m.9958 type:complete len:575 (-) Transcript_3926:57-1781(-)
MNQTLRRLREGGGSRASANDDGRNGLMSVNIHEHMQRETSKSKTSKQRRNGNGKRDFLRAGFALISIVVISIFAGYNLNNNMYHKTDRESPGNHHQNLSHKNLKSPPLKKASYGLDLDDNKTKHSVDNKKQEQVRQCAFRTSPPHRYYYSDPTHKLPGFLADSTYIRGIAPTILDADPAKKICIDQPWEKERFDGRLPFSDGFNPSLLAVHAPHPMIDLYGKEAARSMMFLAFLRFSGSSCSYRDDNEMKEKFNISSHSFPGVRNVITILDSNFEWVDQSPILVELDADFGIDGGEQGWWGGTLTKMERLSYEGKYKFAHVARFLEDIKAFVHQGEVWISYLGQDYGYNGNLVLNKVHFDVAPWDRSRIFIYIKASEAIVICCGRNVAFFSDVDDKLKGVSWVDPLTVQVIEPGTRLASKNENSSEIHGTSDKMVHLPSSSELLGIAHFHRPKHRQGSFCWEDEEQESCNYAQFGHHYTHVLYTISDKAPHFLRRVSNEFMLPLHDTEKKNNAHIIQYASGLSIIGNTLVISYGINDCEPAIIQLPVAKLETLLLDDLPRGTEVRDLMYNLEPN